MAPMFETLFLRLVHLCEVFETVPSGKAMIEIIFNETTDHLQQFRANKSSTFFQERSLYVLLS